VANPSLGPQPFHHPPHLSSPKPPPNQKRRQPPLPHRCRQPRQLPSALLGQRTNRLCWIDAFVRQRGLDRLLSDTSIDAESKEVADQARRSAPTVRLGGGVVSRKARIVEETGGSQPVKRAINGRRGVLLLEQPAAQVEARMRATRQSAQRRPMRGLEIGELLQPLEDCLGNGCANPQFQICEISGS